MTFFFFTSFPQKKSIGFFGKEIPVGAMEIDGVWK